MSTGAPPPSESLREEARRLYGSDPIAYEAGRPEYPERVYELLFERCGLKAGTRALEVGPGTGRVTRRLLAAGAHVLGVEPDPALAEYLRQTTAGENFELVVDVFEDASLPDSYFDLALAAMSFHWIDQDLGLAKLHRALVPGGYVAIWWTVFGDPTRSDPFQDSVSDVLPEGAGPRRDLDPPQFELDVDWRKRDLSRRGFVDVESDVIRWTARMDAAQVRALYSSMIAIVRRPEAEREQLLDTLAHVADRDFGGWVERPFVTALYTARRP